MVVSGFLGGGEVGGLVSLAPLFCPVEPEEVEGCGEDGGEAPDVVAPLVVCMVCT